MEEVPNSGKDYNDAGDREEAHWTMKVLNRVILFLEKHGEPSAALRILDVLEEWETQTPNPFDDDPG